MLNALFLFAKSGKLTSIDVSVSDLEGGSRVLAISLPLLAVSVG